MASRLNMLAALAASAVLFYFGTGFAPIAALTWIAPLPVLLLASRVSAKTAFGVAFAAFLLGQANEWHFWWNTPSVPLPLGLTIITVTSVVFALAVVCFRALLRRNLVVLAAFVPPAIWVTAWYLMTLVSPAGIVFPFATPQADAVAVTQIASITGAWGVEFLVLFAPAASAALLSPGVATRPRLRTGVATVAVFAATLGFGTLRLSDADHTSSGQRVAVLAASHFQWAPDAASPGGQKLVKQYARQIAALPAGVKLVVLPEATFGTDKDSLPNVTRPLGEIARQRSIDIVVGVIHKTPTVNYNHSLAIPASGSKPVAYTKWHFASGAHFQAGHELAFTPGHGKKVGLANCMDLNFPTPSRNYGRAGVQLLATPASDEFGNGWQHSRTGLLRGIESGYSVAWGAQQGNPMISDSWGRILAETDTASPKPFVRAIADVPSSPGATLYARYGDWFAWLCLALTLGGALALRFKPVAAPASRRSDNAGTTAPAAPLEHDAQPQAAER